MLRFVYNSQGTIIGKDAIERVRTRVIKNKGEEHWQQLAAKIYIISVRAVNHLWHAELSSVTSIQNKNDYVATLTAQFSKLLSYFREKRFIFVRPKKLSESEIEVKKSGHGFAHYLGTLDKMLK